MAKNTKILISTVIATLATLAPVPSVAQPKLVGFIHAVSNPEDMVQLPGTSWVIVSGMRSARMSGRLYIVDARKPETAAILYPAQSVVPGASGPEGFAPHGINVRVLDSRRFELLVIDHGAAETIDRLRIVLDEHGRPFVESVATVSVPVNVWPNGIAPTSDGGFVITSMYDPRDTKFLEKFTAGEPTGSVWRWSADLGWRELPNLPLSGANGIALSADGKVLFVAEWALRRIWRVPMDGSKPQFNTVSFLTDNLRWTEAGDLLLAGQLAEPHEIFTCSLPGHSCPMGFMIARVDPASLAITPVVEENEQVFAATGFGGATGAIQVGDSIWVGSFTGTRIARYALPKSGH